MKYVKKNLMTATCIGLGIVGLNSMAYAYKEFHVCNHGKETVSQVICDEPTVLVGTTVKGEVKVVGSLTAKGITVEDSLNVKGAIEISASKVKGLTDIVGNFNSSDVVFSKGVSIEASQISMKKTIVQGSLLITAKETQPILKIACSTTITGTVIFEGKEGLVQVSEDSIVQGKVINGTLEFVKVTC